MAKPEKDPNTKSYLDVNPLPENGGITAVADDFAAFEKVVDKHEKDTRVPPEQIWMKKDAPKPKAKVAEKPVAVEADEDDEADAEEEKKPSDLERAKAALRRDGFRKKHFDVMDDDETLSRGLKSIRRHAKNDETYRIVEELRSKPKETGQGSDKHEAPNKEPEAKPIDFAPVLKKLQEKLALDDEGVSALGEFAKMVGENAAAPLRKELAAFKTKQTLDAESQLGTMLQTAQEEIGESFPDLKDPDTFAEVLKEANAISGSAQFARLTTPQKRISAALKVAAINLGLEHSEESAQQVQDDAEAKSQRRYSRSTVSGRTKAAALTPKERDWQRFNEVADKHNLG